MPFAAGTICYYKTIGGSLVDATGTHGVMVLSGGTAPAVSSPFEGFGPYQAAANHKPPASVQAALSGLTAYTIRIDNIRCDTLPGNMFPWSGQDGGVNYYFNTIGTAGSALFRWATEDGGAAFCDTAAGTLTTGVTYSVTFVYNGSQMKLYVNDILAATTTHAAALPATVASFHYGAAWPPAAIFPFDGYIGGLRLMNVATTSFPITDVSGSSIADPTNRRRRR